MRASRNAGTWICGLVALLTVCLVAARTQTLGPGPQVLTFFSDVDDTDQPYGLYLPPKFDPKKKYPLVIMLHGAASNHRLALRRVFGHSNRKGESDLEATRYFPKWKDEDFIVATPLARGTIGYQGIGEKDVLDVLADVKRRFPIDEDRVYLTGLSMGGGGTLWIGLTRPDIWAAIAPVCPAPPEETMELAPNALNLAVHLFQGDADPLVRPESTRQWVKRLRELGVKTEYAEYPGVGHNSWENAYQDGFIFRWFSQFKRSRYPERVRFVTRWYKYRSAYWLEIDELTPGELASVDARFTGPNRIEVTTSGVRGLTFKLSGHPSFRPGRPVEVSIDGALVHASAKDSLSLNRRAGSWQSGKVQLGPTAKQPGLEGPISEAIASRHVYVYGTAGNPSREELAARRAVASQAVDWVSPMGGIFTRPMIFLRVLADNQVRPSDLESSNLVLFGTRETNALIAKFADRLPIHLKAGAQGYGLLYIYPVAGKYVLVSSGLPWWEGQTLAGGPAATPGSGRRRFTFLPGTAGLLVGLPDWVLFKGSLREVVAEGSFDDMWQLTPSDRQRLLSSGVVALTGQQE